MRVLAIDYVLLTVILTTCLFFFFFFFQHDIPPPASTPEQLAEFDLNHDSRYINVPREQLPDGESLKLTEDRVLVEWHNTIVPALHQGKRLLIAAHGNSLRALVKHLDGISSDAIAGLNIPTGVPLVYELDETTLQPIPHPDAIHPLQGRYLGNQEDIRNRIGAVVAQTK